MRPGNLAAYASRLENALSNLMRKWDAVNETWNDQVANNFQIQHLAHLERQTRATRKAVDDLAEAMAKVGRDCE